ncbi:MAG TPA: hypothetical protein VK012_07380 [Gemmatimonadales bacterium]|nr:hypothetical protein [Gemmatimonadales bacterium]
MRAPVLLFAVLVAVPGVVHAQLGRLSRAVAREAGVTSDVKTGKVAFGGNVVEITEARVQQLIAGLEAESVKAREVDAIDTDAIGRRNDERRAQHDRAMEAWERDRTKREKCLEPYRARMDAAAEKNEQAAEISPATMEAIQKRLAAARDKGDMAEIQRLADSITKAMAPVTSAAVADGERITASARAACGDEKPRPEQPDYEPVPDYSTVRAAGVRASGMDAGVYAMMRERVVAYVASKGRSSGGMMLTSSEAEVLKASLERLRPYTELLQSA